MEAIGNDTYTFPQDKIHAGVPHAFTRDIQYPAEMVPGKDASWLNLFPQQNTAFRAMYAGSFPANSPLYHSIFAQPGTLHEGAYAPKDYPAQLSNIAFTITSGSVDNAISWGATIWKFVFHNTHDQAGTPTQYVTLTSGVGKGEKTIQAEMDRYIYFADDFGMPVFILQFKEKEQGMNDIVIYPYYAMPQDEALKDNAAAQTMMKPYLDWTANKAPAAPAAGKADGAPGGSVRQPTRGQTGTFLGAFLSYTNNHNVIYYAEKPLDQTNLVVPLGAPLLTSSLKKVAGQAVKTPKQPRLAREMGQSKRIKRMVTNFKQGKKKELDSGVQAPKEPAPALNVKEPAAAKEGKKATAWLEEEGPVKQIIMVIVLSVVTLLGNYMMSRLDRGQFMAQPSRSGQILYPPRY